MDQFREENAHITQERVISEEEYSTRAESDDPISPLEEATRLAKAMGEQARTQRDESKMMRALQDKQATGGDTGDDTGDDTGEEQDAT